jgi:release factor glutamine methyltransferase
VSRLTVLGAPAPDGLADLVARRATRIPLQHLVGRAPFRRMELLVGPGVFVPRPETEMVAGLAIEAASVTPTPLVVDLCTGSGAIALAVATEVPGSRVVAVEAEPAAHAWAERNLAERAGLDPGLAHRFDLRLADVADPGLLSELAGAVDVVVANPPYLPPDAEPVDVEVRDHDPARALYGGGDDGLAVPRQVAARAARLLRVGGTLVMEHADVQGPAVRALLDPGAWTGVRTAPDLTGRDRAVVAVLARMR